MMDPLTILIWGGAVAVVAIASAIVLTLLAMLTEAAAVAYLCVLDSGLSEVKKDIKEAKKEKAALLDEIQYFRIHKDEYINNNNKEL